MKPSKCVKYTTLTSKSLEIKRATRCSLLQDTKIHLLTKLKLVWYKAINMGYSERIELTTMDCSTATYQITH